MTNLLLMVLLAVLGLVYILLQIYSGTTPQMMDVTWGAILIVTGILAVRGTTYLLVDVLFTRTQGKQPSALLRLIVAIVLYMLCSIFIFSWGFNQNVAALLATSALLTAILGFALQATLGNLFGGLSLQVEQPFGIGDLVEVDGVRGIIESLTWRSASIRTELGVLHIIPNSQMSDTTIQVLPESPAFGDYLIVPAPLNVPPRRVIEIVDEVVRGTPGVSNAQPPTTLVSDFDLVDGVVRYEVSYYPDSIDHDTIKAVIRERVWYAFHRNGITFPSLVEMPAPAEEREEPSATVDLLGEHPLFAVLDEPTRRALAQSGRRLLFAPDEEIDLDEPVTDALFLVLQGEIQATVPMADRPSNDRPSNDRPHQSEIWLEKWPQETLSQVSTELAHFIGPIANHIVSEAAHQTTALYHLYHLAAQEIQDPTSRQDFLVNAPAVPSIRLQPGDVLGEMALFTGRPFVTMGLEAIGEVELFKLDRSALAPLIRGDSQLQADLCRALVTYRTQHSPFVHYHQQTAEYDTVLTDLTLALSDASPM